MSADENDTCEDNMHRRWMVAEERADEAEVRVKELEAVLLKYGDMQGSLLEKDVLCETIKKAEAERDRLAASKDGAYEERNRVVAALARLFPSGLKKTDIPDWDAEWHGCVYIDTPVGQLSWHYHDSQAHLFNGLPTYEGEWNGHTTEQKYERLSGLSRDRLAAENAGLREALATFTRPEAYSVSNTAMIEYAHQALTGDGSAVLAVVKAARLMRPLGPVTSSPEYTEGWKKLCQALAKLDSKDGKEALDDG